MGEACGFILSILRVETDSWNMETPPSLSTEPPPLWPPHLTTLPSPLFSSPRYHPHVQLVLLLLLLFSPYTPISLYIYTYTCVYSSMFYSLLLRQQQQQHCSSRFVTYCFPCFLRMPIFFGWFYVLVFI